MSVKISDRSLTLEHFLRLPEFKPAYEYIGGRVIQKMSPKLPHSFIQLELGANLNAFVRPRNLGRGMTELRCTFAGRSIVPDIAFVVRERLPVVARGQEFPDFLAAPDLAVEILSEGQTVAELRRKLAHAIRHGTRLGWLIHPNRERLLILRLGSQSQILKSGDILSGEDVLPGYALPIDELFGWQY